MDGSMARRATLAAGLVMAAPVALAHSEVGTAAGFLTGFLHPLSGVDHLIAMVAVGLWGAFLGAPAIWQLPVVFPVVMAVGGILGIAGVPLPFVEAAIATSAVVLGLMVLTSARPPLWIAAGLVGLFAVFHGHAHGTELPHAANPIGYSAGFVIATGLLHLAGIAFGALVRWPSGQIAVRSLGLLISAGGCLFLLRLV
jgi:urease accessory protein